MGSSITIDKHTTTLQDWLELPPKIQQITFNSTPNTHISMWKFTLDQFQSLKSHPFTLDYNNYDRIFNKSQVIVVGLVKKHDYQYPQDVDADIIALLSSIVLNFHRKSLQVCVRKGLVDGKGVYEGQCQYFTYAFMGKRSDNKTKLAALSFACKLGGILENPSIIKVLAGGGVYRNNKLQMGSVIPLIQPRGSSANVSSQFQFIHIANQLMSIKSQNQINAGKIMRAPCSLFSYVPKQNIPVIANLQIEDKKISVQVKKQPHASNHPHIPPIKPPMLKLALKPFQQATYEQMDDEQKHHKFEMRDTARHQLKMQKFSNDCSLVIQGLYLSGQKIAKDEQILKKYNITEIVNCAGDYCPNWFESMKDEENNFRYKYLTFFLKDSQNQNIECLFYRVIDFVDSALKNKRNVLIHCIQGISRSVTFVIAYLIFTKGFDFKQAEAFVKERRGIACPNNGFMVQLIQFYKRLNQKLNTLPFPRVFLISSHCQQTPDMITARMIKQKLFDRDNKKQIGLDERGIYIIQSEEVIYLWVGSKCEDERKMKKYWAYAQSYIKKLQTFEKAPAKIKAIHQGNQGQDFLNLWEIEQLPIQYQNPDYNRLFNQQKPTPKAGYLRKHYEREEEQIQEQFISKLFIYPDHQNGLGVFELDDLAGFCLLVKSDNQKLRVFVWKGRQWNGNTNVEGQFLDRVIEQNFGSYESQKIDIIQEEGDLIEDLSEQFVSCFS